MSQIFLPQLEWEIKEKSIVTYQYVFTLLYRDTIALGEYVI